MEAVQGGKAGSKKKVIENLEVCGQGKSMKINEPRL